MLERLFNELAQALTEFVNGLSVERQEQLFQTVAAFDIEQLSAMFDNTDPGEQREFLKAAKLLKTFGV